MKTVKVFNAKKVKVMKAGRKDNRKSVLVVPQGMNGKDLVAWKDKHLKKIKDPVRIIINDTQGQHYDHNK